MSLSIEFLRLAFFNTSESKTHLLGTGMQQFGECGLGLAWYPNYGNPYVQPMGTLTQFSPPGYVNTTTPVVDPDIWQTMFATYQHTIAVKKDGSLWAAGDNSFGQIGSGTIGSPSYTFQRVLVSDDNDNSWVFGGAGTEHSGALRSDGTVWCWGRNDIAAAVGNGTKVGNVATPHNLHSTPSTHRHFPLETRFIDLRIGHRFNIAMDEDRNLWSWGNNGSRQLGRLSVFGEEDIDPNATQDTHIRLTPTVSDSNNVVIAGPWLDFSAGAYHAGAIKTDGTLYMWGLSGNGQLGAPTPSGGQPNDPRIVPSPVSGKKWARLYCGEYSTAALLEDGTLWVWGSNAQGQLGLGDKDNRSTPTQLVGIWKFCQLGLKSGCGIKTDGTLWVWGSNANGLIGLGSSSESLSPTQIGYETSWICAYPMNLATVALKST